MIAVAPGAFTAAFVLQYLDAMVVKSILYSLMLGSSVLALVRVILSSTEPEPSPLSVKSRINWNRHLHNTDIIRFDIRK